MRRASIYPILLSFIVLPGTIIGLPGAIAAAQTTTPATQSSPAGLPIQHDLTATLCSECHDLDDQGKLSRISYLRKTPEGWQTSIRRMVMLNDVRLEPAEAREILRYLSNNHGIAPEELKPGAFHVERRLIDYRYTADEETETTCKQCHSLGRVITQRRTEDEWGLLLATHRGLYPDVDFQAFRRGGPAEDGEDPRHPMDKAIAHLSEAFPLDTPEWSAWSATMRTPRLAGTWAITGHHPGKGPVFGDVTIQPTGTDGDFTTEVHLRYATSDATVTRTGRSTVYTGFQWRGRSAEAGDSGQLREVMAIDRNWRSMTGRWYTGANDELGMDITLHRVSADPIITGAYPSSVRIGQTRVRVTLFGGNLPTEVQPSDVDFGPGITVARVVTTTPQALTVDLNVAPAATRGARDVFVGGTNRSNAIIVYEAVDRIVVTPAAGMARVGGAAFPKQFQQFEAIGYDDGPDDDVDTDDINLGPVAASWTIEEYAVTYDDDDVTFVGSVDDTGLFTPALDGPNPDRTGNRNNVGDVWVVATHLRPDGTSVRARGHLLVTVPLYIRWDPWGQGR